MQRVKCVVVGDSLVGKTNMLIRYTFDMFTGDYLPTNKSSFDNYESVIVLEDKEIKLDVFDTAGEEYFRKVREQIYKDVNVVILCFSIVQPMTFDNIKTNWVHELRCYNVNVPCILVGTKLDLRDDKKTVTSLEERNLKSISTSNGLQLKKEIKAVKYMECSSLTGEGVKEVFGEAAKVAFFGRNSKRGIICDIL